MDQPANDLLIGREGRLGRITLNRPRALNALNRAMIDGMTEALAEFAADDEISAVLLDGAGERGLCAGGDIRAVHDATRDGDLGSALAFFRAEYRLNAAIAEFPKPYVALMDGIVMGGGVGVSAHGLWRLVTDRTRLAMPETGIGFVPDVGGTWLLGRAGVAGLRAALCSTELNGEACLALGLADFLLPAMRLPEVAEVLAGCETRADVAAALAGLAGPTARQPSALPDWAAYAYARPTMEAILTALKAGPEAAREEAALLARKCPFSLKVTLRAVRTAPGLGSLRAALAQEFRLVQCLITRPDFREGVRAAIIDKDRSPSWTPATLAEIPDALIDAAFAAGDQGGLGW